MNSHTIETSGSNCAHGAAEKKADAQRQYWAEDCPYGDYFTEVDDHLEILIGRTSSQEEMAYIADLQEEFYTPREAAWILARELFFQPLESG